MASSSTCTSQVRYDVFLSFRGKDTRNTFISHLYKELGRKGINAFLDDKLKKGDEILSLMKVIQGSKISIIVFSENYASSRWCLKELAEIIEYKKKHCQIVIPVFYHVDPTDVRHQKGKFGKVFNEHFSDKVHWRTALKETANLSGWHLDETKSESILMEKIIQDILKRLNDMFTNDYKDLVGVGSKIKEIESSFWMGIDDVCTIGIWGIGGIGKTTIASAVYNKISSQFESSYFTQNVREESENPNGLTHLREKLLSTILEDKNLIGTPNMGNPFIHNRLRNKKVFIVFDDVTSFEQIEVLIGDPNYLGFGSRIIITTRDKQVLKNCGINDYQIYPIVGLFGNHALKLFCQSAFKQDDPLVDYIELSNRAVRCAKGVPLALKVLGRHLQNRQRQCWESALDELEESPHVDIQKVLKISYDGLNYKEKDSFLNIACFFKGWNECVVKEILDSCGLHAEIRISVLSDKALITISDNIITMHDLLQALGREIVKQESIHEPEKRSRLWHLDDIYRVLRYNMGTEKTRGICFDMSIIREIYLSPRAFSNMHNLIFFIIKHSDKGKNNKVHGFHRLESHFGELRYLCWPQYPERSLPLEFSPECLAILRMCQSNLEQLWTGVLNLAKLKYIDLSFSKHLLRIPDLSFATNLENLILKNCPSLLEITPPSIQNVNSLINLNLRNCKSLTSLPIGIQSNSLRFVILSGCSNLMTTSKISCNMEQLCLDGSGIKEFSSLIKYPPKLVELNLENCSKLECLANNFGELKSLRRLILRGCSNLKTISKLPCEIEELDLDGTAVKELEFPTKCLTILRMRHTNLEQLWTGVVNLTNLKSIDLSFSKHLLRIPDLSLATNLESLILEDCPNLLEITLPSIHVNSLISLNLKNCKSLTSLPIGIQSKSLRFVNLSRCSNLITAPKISCNMEQLCLDGSGIKKFSSLIEYPPKLLELNLENCSKLQGLPYNFCKLKSLQCLILRGCSNLKTISGGICKLRSLKYLDISGCSKLDRLPKDFANLQSLEVLEANDIRVRDVSSIFCLRNLVRLSLEKCQRELVSLLLPSLSGLQFLRSLNLSHSNITELPLSLGQLSLLKELKLVGNSFERIPTSIIKLSQLLLLDLSYCNKLQFLPKLPRYIESFVADGCTSLQTLSHLPGYAFWRGSFINCLNLDLDLSSEVAVMAANCLSANTEDNLGFWWNSIIYPGDEIPKWFNFQSNGFCIELPQGSFNNVIGFALCTILEFQDYGYNDLIVKYQLHIWEGSWNVISNGSVCAWDNGSRPNFIESNHVCLGFRFYDFQINAKAMIIFQVINVENFEQSKSCKIKKCGVHLFSMVKAVKESRSRRCFIYDDEEKREELKFQNFVNGESSSRSGVPSVNEKEVEELNPIRNESTSLALFDLNELPQDSFGSIMDVVSRTTLSCTNSDGVEPCGSGCCDDEVEPQPKRLKEFKLL